MNDEQNELKQDSPATRQGENQVRTGLRAGFLLAVTAVRAGDDSILEERFSFKPERVEG